MKQLFATVKNQLVEAKEKKSRKDAKNVVRKAHSVSKEEKGMGTLFATLGVLVIAVVAAISMYNWYTADQTNNQQKIDSKQSQLFQ